MKVNINGKNKSYDIVIGSDILSDLAIELEKRKLGNNYIVITDENVDKHYKLPFKTLKIKPGENSKTRKVKQHLEDELIKLKINRDDCIIALGGGVVGDLAGFIASTLYRGINYIQVPTTLLAMVDSSVGGKVAVNHPMGKNLIGNFYQPSLVYTDTKTLETLPKDQLLNGFAELFKHGLIYDREYFNYIVENSKKILSLDPIIQTAIQKSCKIKSQVVEQDEKESGIRKVLNYGHTFGHVIEKTSNHSISHGKAIAIGMYIAGIVSNKLGMLSNEDLETQNNFIDRAGYLEKFTLDTKEYIEIALLDKKARKGKTEYVLLEEIGKTVHGKVVEDKIIKEAILETLERTN